MENPYLPSEFKVINFERESPDNFTLTVDFRHSHEPGQFVMVSLPGIGEAPISIASYSKDSLCLNIREVGSVTNNLAKLRPGDSVFIRGPYGRGYPMKFLVGNNIVLIGGGCGVAPLRGVIEYIAKNRSQFADVDLFFGYRSVHDVLFKKELASWKQHYNTMISIDKGTESDSKSCYDARIGFVTEHLKNACFNNENRVAFLCGPPKMMELAVSALRDKGFHNDQIFVSTERLMQCAVGKCGHCMIQEKYTCENGPVFRWDEIEGCRND